MHASAVQDYSRLSSTYDALRYTTPAQQALDDMRRQAAIALLMPRADERILDVGTGTGSGLLFVSGRVRHMVGLDATASMLAEARRKLEAVPGANVDLVRADALHLPWADATFDAVLSLNFIHLFTPHGLDLQRALVAEMARVCRPRGRVVIEFDNARYLELGNHFHELEELACGMVLAAVVGTYPPKTGRAFDLNPALARRYSALTRTGLLKRFAYKWMVQFVKP